MDPLSPHIAQTNANESLPERAFLVLAMIGICALCFTVTVTVISRIVYQSIIPDEVLIVREVMVITILFPLATVSANRAHISVTIFTDWLSKKGRQYLSVVAHFVGIIFSSCLLLAGFRLFSGAWESGEYYDGDIYIPMWIGYATFLLAIGILLLRLIVNLFFDFRSIRPLL